MGCRFLFFVLVMFSCSVEAEKPSHRIRRSDGTDPAFTAAVARFTEIAKSSFSLTDHIVSTVDKKINPKKPQGQSFANGLELISVLLSEQVVPSEDAPQSTPDRRKIVTECRRARELTDGAAIVFFEAQQTNVGHERAEDVAFTLSLWTAAETSYFTLMEISQVNEEISARINLDNLDQFYDRFMVQMGDSRKSFRVDGILKVQSDSDSLHIRADRAVSADSDRRLYLEQISIEGRSFQNLSSVKMATRVAGPSGIELRPLTISLSGDGIEITEISLPDIPQFSRGGIATGGTELGDKP